MKIYILIFICSGLDPVTKRLVVWQELLLDNQTASELFMNSDAIHWLQIGLENLKNSWDGKLWFLRFFVYDP